MKNLKLILKSLISNHSCVEGGRKKAWYFAIPMFLIAMVLALIPSFVQNISKQGDAAVASNTYEMDVASQRFLESVEDNGISMKIVNQSLVIEGDWTKVASSKDKSDNTCYIHKHKNAVSGEESEDLSVYYRKNVDQDYWNSITTFPYTNENGEQARANRTYSFILFSEKSVIVGIYSNGSQKSIIYGDYQSLPEGYTINSIYAKDDVAKSWGNWKEFYRRIYDNNRIKLTWQTTGILAAINAGITIFMGFMLWILTRGKNNLRWFNLWETQKIAYWATISPAILAVGLGFLITQFSQVMFPLLLGVRVMWLSMKLLRPENAAIYPPLKNEKVVDVKPVK